MKIFNPLRHCARPHGVGLRQNVHPTHRALLPNQFRQQAVVADEVLGAGSEVGELCGCEVDTRALVEGGEDVAEMDWAGFQLLPQLVESKPQGRIPWDVIVYSISARRVAARFASWRKHP